MSEIQIVDNARKHIERDPDLAVYMCRDLDITKQANLDDMAWALYRGNCHKNDAYAFFEYLDKYINDQVEAVG